VIVNQLMKIIVRAGGTTRARGLWIGFTLIEVVVALAVVLILAAVALPNITGYLDQKRVDAAGQQLTDVRDALYDNTKGANSFFQIVGMNAGRLSELDSVIIAGDASYATGTDNSCGNAFTAKTEVPNWLTGGPFMTYNSDRTFGMMTPIGKAEDSLTRIPNSASAGVLRINFLNNVALADAQLLDVTIDGSTGYNAGVVQWTPQAPASGVVTMYYIVTINNRC
jgi:prepilin-type N-terminal cleavage/methylation domain-containing protein